MASSTDVTSADASALLQKVAASGCLAKQDMRDAARACEVGKAVLRVAAAELVAAAHGAPILNSKSADGTPINVAVRYASVLPSGARVRRYGRAGEEFLVKNQFLRVHLPGTTMTRVLLQEPQPLSHGKSAAAIFQACKKDWRSLREMGHRGCAVEHFCYDRCGLTAHERLWRQWHAMSAASFGALAAPVPAEVLRLSEFVVFTACAAHDAQSAFRWGMRKWLGDKDLLRDVYVCIESLRRSMDLIHGHLAEWVASRIEFVDELQMDAVDQRRLLWQALDVEMETADVLAEVLQLTFEGGRLRVARSVSARADLVDLIVTALSSVWRFKRWCESRFLTAGVQARTVVAAMLTGIEDLVAFIRADESASKFFINGFTRLQGPVKVFFAECAFVSRVSDGVMAELMEDSRVALRYDSLFQCLSEDMLWLAMVPHQTWQHVASVAKIDPGDLRSNCVAGGHLSYHFSGVACCSQRQSCRGDWRGGMWSRT